MCRSLVVALIPLLVVACGASEGPPDPSWRFLSVGVDPLAEADAVRRTLEEGGWRLVDRVEGETFVAQTFRNPRTGESAARIVTRRGIALAVDVPAAESAQPIRVVDPVGADHDLDHDGDEEIVLARHDPAHDRTCLGALRVDAAEGFLRPVPEDLSHLGDLICVETLEDVDADGHPEGVAVLRLPELSRGTVPEVPVPVELEGGRWRALPGAAARWDGARARLGEEAERARQERDVDRAYVLAVEAAALERAAGGSRREQLLAFDRILSGLVLSEAQAGAVRDARSHVAGGWQRD